MLKWGVLGTARINQKTLPAIQAAGGQELEGVASRSMEKAKAHAEQFGIARAFRSYQALIDDDGIDAVYISLPNDLHFEWARKALRNGKHVLCEKPMTLTGREARVLSEVSRETGCVLMEGFMYRHHRQTQELKRLIIEGRIGELRHVRGSFHFTIPDGPNIRMNVANGGGAIWDVGCYLVDLIQFLFDGAPSRVFASSDRTKESVDTSFSALMDYGEGRAGLFDCGFKGPRRDLLEIVGTDAIVQVDHPFKATSNETIRILSDKGVEAIRIDDQENSYVRQFQNFLAVVQGSEGACVSLEESARTAKTVETLIQSAESRTALALT